MNYPSSRNIISILIAFCCLTARSQENRSQRLTWQYLGWINVEQNKKDSFQLLAADAALNEGNYQLAVSMNEGVKENAGNKSMKFLVSGKAEFLNENFEGSLTFFENMDPAKLTKDQQLELGFLRTLDHVHLLDTAKAIRSLAQMMKNNGKDSVGIKKEMYSIPFPKQYDMKKAKRKSWIPGAGLCYVGERKKAAGSILLDAVFLGYTGYSIYTQHYITSVVTGLAQFMRFYSGGRRAAFKIGSKKNREAYIKYVIRTDELVQKKYFELKN